MCPVVLQRWHLLTVPGETLSAVTSVRRGDPPQLSPRCVCVLSPPLCPQPHRCRICALGGWGGLVSASLRPHADGWGGLRLLGSPQICMHWAWFHGFVRMGCKQCSPGCCLALPWAPSHCPLVSSTEPPHGGVSAVRCCAFSPPPAGALRCLAELEMVPEQSMAAL